MLRERAGPHKTAPMASMPASVVLSLLVSTAVAMLVSVCPKCPCLRLPVWVGGGAAASLGDFTSQLAHLLRSCKRHSRKRMRGSETRVGVGAVDTSPKEMEMTEVSPALEATGMTGHAAAVNLDAVV